MNNEKADAYTLNTKEYNEITKAHNDFDKTMFGKKIKMFTKVLSIFCILFIIMAIFCIVLNAVGEKNFDIFAAICGGLSFVYVGLIIVSLILYESMAMNYNNYKK